MRAHLRRLVRHIRKGWPETRITFRTHARPEATPTWCEKNGATGVFGLPGTQPPHEKVDDKADEVRVERAMENRQVVRGYAETRHKAKSWTRERRAVARIEATPLGLDIRFVVTNLECGSAEWIYDSSGCARGQAENLDQAAQDAALIGSHVLPFRRRQSVRLVLHTSAYWLMLTVRDAIPKQCDLPRPSSRPCAFVCSKSPLASSKPPEPCAWPSRPVIPRRPSPACPARSPRSALDRWGIGPFPVPFLQRVIKKCEPSNGENPNDDPQPKSPRTKISEKHRCL